MDGLAWIFPGQGSQKVGMGRDLWEEYPVARECFQLADRVLETPLTPRIFQGPEQELILTENLQPALLATSLAAVAVLRKHGVPEPVAVAGHSLGEYSALVAAGALDLEDALRIVRLRGRRMQQAAPPGTGGMAAMIGITPDQAGELCREASQERECVAPANFNGAGQVVISGHAAALDRALEMGRERGFRRAIRLRVSVPFHSPLMEQAGEIFARDLQTLPLRAARIPLVRNVDARWVTDPEEIREGLRQQFSRPVRWEESVQVLAEKVSGFLEIGPGQVLARMVSRILKNSKARSVGDVESLESFLEGEA